MYTKLYVALLVHYSTKYDGYCITSADFKGVCIKESDDFDEIKKYTKEASKEATIGIYKRSSNNCYYVKCIFKNTEPVVGYATTENTFKHYGL